MAGTRKLVIEVLGDARDGAKALLDIRSNADKTAERMTTFGTAAMAAGAAVAGGLMWAATQAADADMQSRKLDNSIRNSSQTFRRNGDDLRDLAQAIQSKTAADGDAIVGMQSLLVQYGYSESAVKTLTPLVVDLSRKMGVDLETAGRAVAKSADGSAGALKKMGIDVDETKMKVDPLAATVDALSSSVGGFAEEEGATFSGSLERMRNQLGDIVEGVGGGAIETFSGITDKLQGLLGAASSANPEIGNTVGKLGSIGATAAIAVGGLSFIGGKALEARDRFTTLGDDGTRSLNLLGKAAAGLGIASTFVAAGFALDSFIKSVQRSQQELDKLTAAKGSQDIVTLLDSIGRSAKGLGGTFQNLKVGNLFQPDQWGLDRLNVYMGDTLTATTNLDRAMGELYKNRDYANLEKGVRAIQDALADPRNAEVADDLNNILDDYRGKLNDSKAAADASASSQDGLASATADAGAATQDATSSLQEYADAQRATVDPLFAVVAAQGRVADAAAKAQKALDEKDLAGYADATMDVAKAQADLESALGDLTTKVQNNEVSLDDAKAALDRWVKSGVITQAQADLVKAKFDGATGAAMILGAQRPTPKVDADLSAWQSKIPFVNNWRPAPATQQVGANTGGWLQSIIPVQTWQPNNKVAGIYGNANPFWSTWQGIQSADLTKTVRLFGIPIPGIGARALGGPVTKDLPYVVGEKGWELFVPNESGRILTHEESKRWAADMGRPAMGPATSSASTGGAVAVTINVDVTGQTDPVAAGRRTVEAIVDFARTSGFKWPSNMVNA